LSLANTIDSAINYAQATAIGCKKAVKAVNGVLRDTGACPPPSGSLLHPFELLGVQTMASVVGKAAETVKGVVQQATGTGPLPISPQDGRTALVTGGNIGDTPSTCPPSVHHRRVLPDLRN